MESPKALSAAYLELSTREGYNSVLDWVAELELTEDIITDEVGENLTLARANMKSYFDKGNVLHSNLFEKVTQIFC